MSIYVTFQSNCSSMALTDNPAASRTSLLSPLALDTALLASKMLTAPLMKMPMPLVT